MKFIDSGGLQALLTALQQRGYETMLIVAAMRGTHHVTQLAGAEIIMSIPPALQQSLLSEESAA